MENNSAHGSDVEAEVLSIWKEFDPVEGYAAGLDDCKGKLFIPCEAARTNLEDRIKTVEARLDEITNDGYRTGAKKILESIRCGLLYDRPQSQVFSCALALWYPVIKDEVQEDLMGQLLPRVAEALKLECAKWTGKPFSGEECKSVADAVAFLSQMLSTIAAKNTKVTDAIENVRKPLRQFRSLFPSPLSDDLDELFSFFEQYSVPAGSVEGYRDALNRLFDYGASAEEILDQSMNTLNQELDLVKDLIPKLENHLSLNVKQDTLGDIYDKMTKRYEIKDAVAEAKNIIKAVDKYIDCYVQDIPNQPVTLEATPPFLKDLVTSGATLALDYLKPTPKVVIYVTKEKNTSWLTLVNVLVHEATHAYQPIILSGESSLRELAKLRTWLAIPFMEATAFHREFEIFDAVREAEKKRRLNNTETAFLKMFDAPKFSLEADINSFELETRIWRIMRALRSICDVQVNCRIKTYVEFVNWAVNHSGLKREFIHNECFTFLSVPGYTPSYSFCGTQYQALQSRAADNGVTQLEFNTKANCMGLWPWTTCVTKMKDLATPERREPKT